MNISGSTGNQETLNEQKLIGFRSVKLVQQPVAQDLTKGLTFYFKVNDKPTFLKGANWIPGDSFLAGNLSCDRLQFFFHSMQMAHMNAIRVWGGGQYEPDCFYDLADKFGILIWQDFMFAVALYPSTTEFLNNVKAEVTDQVRRLQHHPSILIWAGNNENELGLVDGWFPSNATVEQLRSDYLALYRDTIGPLVKQLDPSRPFVLSSPSNGDKTVAEGGISTNPGSNLYGDVHFYDYFHDGWDPAVYPQARCVTEYGYQSLPSIETLQEALDDSDLAYFSPQMDHRQHHPSGSVQMFYQVFNQFSQPTTPQFRQLLKQICHLDYLGTICISNNETLRVDETLFTPKEKTQFLSQMIYLTQVHQAMAIKTETEVYRRQQSVMNQTTGEGLTMCSLYWQLNDIWQGPTWSSIDYGGRWKILHHYAVEFFAPVLVSPYIDRHLKEDLVVSGIDDENLQSKTLH